MLRRVRFGLDALVCPLILPKWLRRIHFAPRGIYTSMFVPVGHQ